MSRHVAKEKHAALFLYTKKRKSRKGWRDGPPTGNARTVYLQCEQHGSPLLQAADDSQLYFTKWWGGTGLRSGLRDISGMVILSILSNTWRWASFLRSLGRCRDKDSCQSSRVPAQTSRNASAALNAARVRPAELSWRVKLEQWAIMNSPLFICIAHFTFF